MQGMTHLPTPASPMEAFPSCAGLRPDPLRSQALDALRGVALVWMAVFHFQFDLAHLGLTQQNFYTDPFWTWQRVLILGLFLFCAGMGQAMAHQAGVGWNRFARRWLQILVCALLVTAGSWWLFPKSFITFGVLHAMLVMLVLPWWVQHPFFDSRLTHWVGLVTRKPYMEDFVPLMPWGGVVLWGLACGLSLQQNGSVARRWLELAQAWRGWHLLMSEGRLTAVGLRASRGLALLGRHSLLFYMVHQPVFFGLLWGWLYAGG
jgi:uncharacterized membrane protein